MSTGNGAVGPGGRSSQTAPGGNQPTGRREWGYSRGWRRFTVIILRPLLRLLMKYQWQGRENFPKTGGVILAPNHLSYADWGAIALYSYSYGHRFPVFMIKSGVFEVKLIGPLLYNVGQLPVYRGRGDAGLVLKQAEQALAAGACVIVYPEGTATRDPDLWPMVGKTGAARLALSAGVPVIPIASWGAQDVLPYGSKKPKLWPRTDDPDGRRAAGGPVGLRRPAAVRIDPAGRDRRHHGRYHRPAGQDQAADAARRTVGPRRRRSACCYGTNGRWCSGPGRCLASGGGRGPAGCARLRPGMRAPA